MQILMKVAESSCKIKTVLLANDGVSLANLFCSHCRLYYRHEKSTDLRSVWVHLFLLAVDFVTIHHQTRYDIMSDPVFEPSKPDSRPNNETNRVIREIR